jgi:lipopolysaccharide cholinephosphotransferase
MPRFYEPETLKKLQKVELEILSDFIDLCERHNLTWFGIAGTGIGAKRHQGFIPWDDDIDVAMPRESFDRFLKLADQEYGDRYRILNAWTNRRFPMMTTRWTKKGTTFIEPAMKGAHCPCGIFLDIYVLDPVADGRIACELQSWEAWFWSKLLVLRCMPKPFLFQTGWMAKLIWLICGMVHRGLKILHISPAWLRDRCEKVCRRYEKKKTRRIAFLPDTSPYWNVFEVDKLYPLRKLPFDGLEVNFPNNVEECLTRQYGEYMTLPPVEKRKTHYPYRLSFEREE